MHEQNLDIYGHAPIPWSRALKQLEALAREEGPGRTRWLATTDPDGRAAPGGGRRDLGRWQVLHRQWAPITKEPKPCLKSEVRGIGLAGRHRCRGRGHCPQGD